MISLWTLFDVYIYFFEYLDLDSDYGRTKHFNWKTDSGNLKI